MKVSLNWCQQNSNVDLAIISREDLLEKIGAQLGAIDDVISWGERYDGIVVAEVVECIKHPNADKLSLCVVNDGGVTKDVERLDDGNIQVVCGAPNVAKAQLVAYIPPGVVVPSTQDKDPLKLEAREIRGTASNGMIASAHELGISSDHTGILVIEPSEVGEDKAKPGSPFKYLYDLDDLVVDIENKMFTHRPDCFGILGVARELAGIQQQRFVSPSWYLTENFAETNNSDNKLKLSITNSVQELVPRFMAVALDKVTVAPSPTYIQAALSRVGIKPINNVVDATNFVMMLTGQPLHAYDYDKLDAAELNVRVSEAGEELVVLGGKQVKISAGSIVIADGSKLVGLGGVMGGAGSEVDENTKRIVLECGTFDMNATRRSAMVHGLFTDAATRFTKNQSKLQNPVALHKAIELLKDLAGAVLASELFDLHKDLQTPQEVRTTAEFINSRLGLELSSQEISDLLLNVEFKVEVIQSEIKITPPFWRNDIAIEEDIVEEVGRLYGYNRLPKTLPNREIYPTASNKLLDLKDELSDLLAAAGANEVLTYSFVHSSLLQKAGQDPGSAFKLRNAISPDLQYYRLSLMPSLLDKVHPNIKQGFGKLAIFEIGKTHNKLHLSDGQENVPEEFNMLALCFAANEKSLADDSGAAYFQAKAYLDYLGVKLGLEFIYNPLDKTPDFPVAKPYDYSRSAAISVAGTDIGLGMIGEFRSLVATGFKLPKHCAGFEIGLSQLSSAVNSAKSYQPLSKYPKAEQDITLAVPNEHNFRVVYDCVLQSLREHQPADSSFELIPLDIFQKDQKTKNISLRLNIKSMNKTLTDIEINKLLDEAARSAKQALGAERA